MKRLLMAMTLILFTFVVVGCTAPPEPWEQMTELAEPLLISDVNKEGNSLADIFTTYDLYASRSIVMNDEETLYYAPLSIRVNAQIFLNQDIDAPVYFIYNCVTGDAEIVGDAVLKEIFKE